MREQKIFGVVSVILLLVVGFSPAISSFSIPQESPIDDFFINLHSCQYKEYTLLENLGYVAYDVDYTVGVPAYFEGKLTVTLEAPDKTWEWETPSLPWSPEPNGLRETHRLYIKEENERYLAGKDFTITTEYGGSDTGFGKYWSEDEDYDATKTQYAITSFPNDNWNSDDYIEIVNPDTLETVNLHGIKSWLFNIENPDSENPEESGLVPLLFYRAHRFGWLSEFTYHLLKSLAYLTIFIARWASCLFSISLRVFSIVIAVADLMLLDPTDANIFDAIGDILSIGFNVGYLLLTLSQIPKWSGYLKDNLIQSLEDFKDFMQTEPWNQTININGAVYKCKNGEEVNVYCRENSTMAEVTDVPGKQEFNFSVEHNRILTNCQIRIEGDMHSKDLETYKILSYACAGGSLSWYPSFNSNGDVVLEEQSMNLESYSATSQSTSYSQSSSSTATSTVEGMVEGSATSGSSQSTATR